MTLAVWKDWESIGVSESLVIALISIVIVFVVILVIILITHLIQGGMKAVDHFTTIDPKEENKILNDDEDAVVAVLVATIEFYKECGKEARVKSIKRIED